MKTILDQISRPSLWVNSASVMGRSLVHLLGLAIHMITGQMWDTMEIFIFGFCCFFVL